MKENGVIRRRLSGKEADPYIGLGRKILGEMKNIMQLGGIKQLSWTKDLQNGVRIVVSSIFGRDEVRILVPVIVPSVLPVEIIAPEQYRSIDYRLWLVLPSGITRLDQSTGGRLESSAVTFPHNSYPSVLMYNDQAWFSTWLGVGYAPDILHMTEYTTGLDTIIAQRNIAAPEGSHTYASTLTPKGVMFLIGRVSPRIYLFDTNGALIYDVPVTAATVNISENWVGDTVSGVNNGGKAYFSYTDTSGALRGILEVDVATGENINHNHSGQWFHTPELGYRMEESAFIVGNDNHLYGIVHRLLDAEPWDSYEVVKLDTQAYNMTAISDISEYGYDGSGAYSVVNQVHASVSLSGLAFICNEFKYVVINTNNGEIVKSGSTVTLLGLKLEEFSTDSFEERIYGYGVIIPNDRNANTTTFCLRRGVGGGILLSLIHLDLNTLQLEELVIPNSADATYIAVEYIGSDNDGNDAVYYQQRNMIYNTGKNY